MIAVYAQNLEHGKKVAEKFFSLNCFQPCHLLRWVGLDQLVLNQFAKTVKTAELKVYSRMSDSLIHC